MDATVPGTGIQEFAFDNAIERNGLGVIIQAFAGSVQRWLWPTSLHLRL